MSEFSVKHDTTPATHGDLDIWAGRLGEVITETAEDTKKELRQEIQDSAENVKEELRAEIKESAEDVKKELRVEIQATRQELKNDISELKDNQLEMMLIIKAIEKKVLEK